MASRADEIISDLERCADGACTGCLYENEEAGCADQLKREGARLLKEYVDRCKRYADEIMALREQQRWIPGCIDRELARIMGSAFQPWEVRYPEKVFGGR